MFILELAEHSAVEIIGSEMLAKEINDTVDVYKKIFFNYFTKYVQRQQKQRHF